MSRKHDLQHLAEQSQTATQQAAETLQAAKDAVAKRLQALRARVGLEPRRITLSDLKPVSR